MNSLSRLTLSFAAVCAIASPAFAGASDADTIVEAAKRDGRPVAFVSLSGLDLKSATGEAIARKRIASAARSVCVTAGVRPVAQIADEQGCKRDAISAAEPQLAAAIRSAGTDLAQAPTITISL